MAVAHGGLGNLRVPDLDVQQDQPHQPIRSVKLVHQYLGRQVISTAGALHHGLAAEHRGDAQHAFLTDQSELGTRTVLQYLDNRDNPLDREIHMVFLLSRFIDDRSQTQRHVLQAGCDASVFRLGDLTQ